VPPGTLDAGKFSGRRCRFGAGPLDVSVEELLTERCVMCPHFPTCPSADRPDREAARIVALHPSQGWGLLCNGVIVFDDAGQILPDGRAVAPRPVRLPALAST
jgi:hypothetical protein